VQYSDSYFSYDLWCIKTVQLNNCVIKYRITKILKVETHIIASIAASPTGRAVILVIMYVEILKTGIIVFIGDVKMCLMSH